MPVSVADITLPSPTIASHGPNATNPGSAKDGISLDQFSPTYATIDMAISVIIRKGPGSFLTKVDIRIAFRLCPVRPSDWPRLGIEWQGIFYYYRVLPFGLRSAPIIFNSFTDSIEWILQDTCHLDEVMHYIDDFLNVTGPNLALATAYRDLILELLAHLSVPVAYEKVKGPTTKLVFLGIVLNTATLSSHLPCDKVQDIRSSLHGILARCFVSHRELASAVGKLSFALRANTAGSCGLREGKGSLYQACVSWNCAQHRHSLFPPAMRQGARHPVVPAWNSCTLFCFPSGTRLRSGQTLLRFEGNHRWPDLPPTNV